MCMGVGEQDAPECLDPSTPTSRVEGVLPVSAQHILLHLVNTLKPASQQLQS
jgi:hypothetical protein